MTMAEISPFATHIGISAIMSGGTALSSGRQNPAVARYVSASTPASGEWTKYPVPKLRMNMATYMTMPPMIAIFQFMAPPRASCRPAPAGA